MTARLPRHVWRSLAADPWHALAALATLALGLAAFALLTAFVRHAWNVDAEVPEHVYILKQRDNTAPQSPWYDQAPMALARSAAAVPGVTAATAFVPLRPELQGLVVRAGGRLAPLTGLTVLPGFGAMLGLAAGQGDLETALARPDGIVLTAEAARRLFGTEHALGRTLRAEGQVLKVAAVLPPRRHGSTIAFDALVGVQCAIVEAAIREELLTARQGWPGKVLLRLAPGTAPQAVQAALQQAVGRIPGLQPHDAATLARLGGRPPLALELAPLRHAYFDDDIGSNFLWSAGERANPVLVGGLAAVALLILALAASNYVNLAAVRVLRRQREIAVRKVLGARARDVALHCAAEAVGMAALASALGLLLAWLALPAFAALAGRQLDAAFDAGHVAGLVATGLLLGAVAAVYPAWLAARVRPERALAGKPGTEGQGAARMRRALTVLQLAAAMGVASVALAIAWQARFAAQAAPGFDPDPLTLVDLPGQVRADARARGYMAALAAQPGIEGVTVSLDAVGRSDDPMHRQYQRPGGQGVALDAKWVGANYFTLYGIRARAGRLFDPRTDRDDDGTPLVLNAEAARALGFADMAQALGQTVLFHDWDGKVAPRRIVGIAPPLRFQSLREQPHPVAFELSTAGATLTVRSQLPLERVDALLRQLWPRWFPDALPRIHRAGAVLARNYADDARLARLLALATGVALALAAAGCYSLSAHTVQRRAAEIVLRKLHGARAGAIGLLVLRETGTLALLGAAAGLPLAAVVIERYLAGYVERAPLQQWALPCALAATVAVALAAAARQAWLAMGVTPAQALRS
ncbi:ABC-type antimicrobial peptide transport system permease subunit [Pseudoduganella flava]|uniref:ABC-type antimicrobial peptide transport system permease subunit n=1 Tax=Pseudoduganella flava TaxID=871742 RepID=A0A562PH44_9BURK|nr:ABC transporter permease [Pseudoduganella flava]QGZ42605.1 FtsX-like permease family protein [Pseudoduganella flava]TWI43761.1 ABC-type antimicrobial peptide transport system permease subunit [Pseudoduganella flava]